MSFPSYLASDMEEDNQAPKQAIFSFLFGKNRSKRPLFHKLRFQFVRSMGWKTRVSQEECEEVGGLWGFTGADWARERRDHGGSELGFGDQKELGARQGEREVPLGESSSSQGAICRSRSRLFIQSSGCGREIAPSFPRLRRPEVPGLRKVGTCPPRYRWNDLLSIYEI